MIRRTPLFNVRVRAHAEVTHGLKRGIYGLGHAPTLPPSLCTKEGLSTGGAVFHDPALTGSELIIWMLPHT
jgi:hypothetical protein